MRKDTKSVHLPSLLMHQLKRKALEEDTTIKKLIEKAVLKSLTPKSYPTEGY